MPPIPHVVSLLQLLWIQFIPLFPHHPGNLRSKTKCAPFVPKETLELYVAGVLKGLLAFDNATAHSYTELLVRYRTSFHNYSVGMHYGSNLFKYLDRHWINTNHCETGVSPKDGVRWFLVRTRST